MKLIRPLNTRRRADAKTPRQNDRERQARNTAAAVSAEGKSVTYDMKPDLDDPTAVGTSEMADSIIAKIG